MTYTKQQQNIHRVLSNAMKEVLIYWARMFGQYTTKDSTFRGAQVRENILVLADKVLSYAAQWGTDFIVLGTACSHKGLQETIITDRKCKTVTGRRLKSGIVLTNTQGITSIADWFKNYLLRVPLILVTCTNPLTPQAAIIWVKDLCVDDFEIKDGQIAIKAGRIFSDRFYEIQLDPCHEKPLVGFADEVLMLEANGYMHPNFVITAVKQINKLCAQSDTKDQNENSLTQSNSLPMNAIQGLPSTVSVEQESSVQPCVNTV